MAVPPEEIMQRACDAVAADTFAVTVERHHTMHPTRGATVSCHRTGDGDGDGDAGQAILRAHSSRLVRGIPMPYHITTAVLESDNAVLVALLAPSTNQRSSARRRAVLGAMRLAIIACAEATPTD